MLFVFASNGFMYLPEHGKIILIKTQSGKEMKTREKRGCGVILFLLIKFKELTRAAVKM